MFDDAAAWLGPPGIALDFPGGQMTLSLVPDGTNGWCNAQLVPPDERRFIGAETLARIKAGFVGLFADRTPGTRCVLTFAETHTTVGPRPRDQDWT